MLNRIGEELIGENAIIQIQSNGKSYVKVIGNSDKVMTCETVLVEENTDFVKWVKEEIERQPFGESTKQNHRAWLKIITGYHERIMLKDLTLQFICNFEIYLKERGYKINTIGKEMKILKKYVNILIDNDMLDKSPFRKYKIKSEETHKNHLTEREIKKLENAEENLSDNEKRVIRPFLFSIFSGLRYSDIRRVSCGDIKSINKNKWVVLRMKKTDREVRVPISKMFGGHALNYISGKTGKLFSDIPNNSETNIILSRIMKKVHIRKHISFHCARHTTATLLLYKGANLTTIQRILGHQSIKTTQVYSAVTDRTIYKDIKHAFR